MRIRVDAERCQGHTLCNMVAPELFGLREEDGHSFVTQEQVPAALEEVARKAALGCPERAIEVDEAVAASGPLTESASEAREETP